MATKRRPPVIPEIAKAYQNDPRTLLARTMMGNGTSTTPVAEGKYGFADGAARALQAVAGAYVDKQNMGRYAGDEAELLAQRKARGVDGLSGAPAIPLPTPQPSPAAGPPPQAVEVAAALGAPPTQPPPPPGPPMIPAAPIPPVQGAGPSRRPFGPGSEPASGSIRDGAMRLAASGARITSGYRSPEHNAKVGGVANSYHTRGTPDAPQAYDFAPKRGQSMAELHAQAKAEFPGYDVINEGDHVHVEPSSRMAASGGAASPALLGGPAGDQLEPVPDAPAPMARPNAPEAVKAGRSKLLDAAYRIMMDANPYESASGQDMYVSGLSDQDKMNESALEREQRLRDMGYQTDLGMYSDAQSQDRGNAYQERRDVQGRNFQAGESATERTFKAGESAKDRDAENWRTRFSASTQIGLNRSQQEFQRGENALDRELTREGKPDKVGDRQAQFFLTAAGAKILESNSNAIASAGTMISTLNSFEAKLKETKRVGGALLGNAPGLVKWSNTDLQVLDGMANELALGKAGEMKGALSDKDREFLVSIVPSIRKTRRANMETIVRMRNIAQRGQDFAVAKVDAMASGRGPQFLREWTAYTNSVPAGGPDYDTWRNSRPTFDRDGNEVKK